MYCCTKINNDIIWIGVNDRKTERFENYIPLDNGVTYNSYLILDEKICIIDGVEEGENGNFLGKIEAMIGTAPVDYIIVNHVEPDHSGSIKNMLKIYPEIKVVGNAKTIMMLKLLGVDLPDERIVVVKEKDVLDLGKHKLTFYLMPMVHWPESMATYDITDKILFSNDAFGSFGTLDERIVVVKEKDVLDLGKHKLTFYLMPMVHWPESMATYDITDKILFSNDAFGSFGTLDGGVFDDEVNTDFFTDEMRRYYSNIVGKFGAPVNAVLKKLSSVEISCICPSHGLIWRKYIKEIIERYQKWANMEPTKEGVVIVYGSMYGHTAEMAEVLGRELGNRGIKDVIIYDSSKTDHSYIFSTIWKYKALILGSCAHNNDIYPKMEPLLHKLENYGLKNRYLGIFGNMMWSGGGVKRIKEFADTLTGLEQVGEPIEIKGHVTPAERDRLIELANLMADKLIADRK